MSRSVSIRIDDHVLDVPEGTSLAAALLSLGETRFRDDTRGAPRGLFCHMGTCCECMVWIAAGDGWRRTRSCLILAVQGQVVYTRDPRTP